jgi:hypothetical protein
MAQHGKIVQPLLVLAKKAFFLPRGQQSSDTPEALHGARI